MGAVADRCDDEVASHVITPMSGAQGVVSHVTAQVSGAESAHKQARQGPQQPVPVEGTCAFVCDGTCGGVLDRPFACSQSTCTYFKRPMRANPVAFICSACNSRESTGPRLCCHTLARAYVVAVDPTNGNEQLRPVWSVAQFPAAIHATDCGPHVQPMNKQGITPTIEPPSMETVWVNRHVLFENVVISGSEFSLAPNHVVVAPEQHLRLSLSFVTHWRNPSNDYCQVQWYVGMRSRSGASQFSLSLIRAFLPDLRGQVEDFEFYAPTFPGVYYINTNFSLGDDFVPMRFSNEPHNSIGVIQVAYLNRWSKENHFLLPYVERRSIEAFFKLGGASKRHHHRTVDKHDCPCRLGTLEGPVYSKIFSFFGPYRDHL